MFERKKFEEPMLEQESEQEKKGGHYNIGDAILGLQSHLEQPFTSNKESTKEAPESGDIKNKTPEQIQERQRKAARLGDTPISKLPPDNKQVKAEQRKEEIGELKKTAKGVLDAYMESSVGEKIATPALLVGLLVYGTLYVPFKLIMYTVKKMDSKAASDFNKTYKSVYDWMTGKNKKGKGGGGKQKEIPRLAPREVQIRTNEALHQRLNEDHAAALARGQFKDEEQKEYERTLRALRNQGRIEEILTLEDEKGYEEDITQSRNELIEKNIWTEEQKEQHIKEMNKEEEEEKKEIVIRKARRKKQKKDDQLAREQYQRVKREDQQENPQDYNQPQDQPKDNQKTEEPPEKEIPKN